MSHDTRVIVGLSESGEDRHEMVLLRVHELESGGEKPRFSASIRDANNGPEMKVRKNRPAIQVTESTADGLREYTYLSRDDDDTWHFSRGTIVTMQENGWMDQGSGYAMGQVVWDSGKTLDRVLEAGDR